MGNEQGLYDEALGLAATPVVASCHSRHQLRWRPILLFVLFLDNIFLADEYDWTTTVDGYTVP